MTNILAFKIPHEGAEYLFIVTDSQSSWQTPTGWEKSTAQKLVKRGEALIASTGRGDLATAIELSLLEENLQVPAYALAEKVLVLANKELGRSQYARYPESLEQCPTTFVVGGKGGHGLELYEVPITPCPSEQRGIYPVELSSLGSGAGKVMRARSRDYKLGLHVFAPDLVEALAFCYSMGKVAAEDMTVDDKLAYGFITHNVTRLLLPPSVDGLSSPDWTTYINDFSGMDLQPWKNFGDDNFEKSYVLGKVIAAFYDCLCIELDRMHRADVNANIAHSGLKVGNTDYTPPEYEKALKQREQHKARVREMFELFLKGGIENIVGAVRGFYERQEEYLKTALSFKPT